MESDDRHVYSDRDRERDRDREKDRIRERDRERERDKDKERDKDLHVYSTVDDRELSSVSNSSGGSAHRRSQEPIDVDRGMCELFILSVFYSLLCFGIDIFMGK